MAAEIGMLKEVKVMSFFLVFLNMKKKIVKRLKTLSNLKVHQMRCNEREVCKRSMRKQNA